MKWLCLFFLFPLTLCGQTVDSLQFYRVKANFSQHSITHIMEDDYGFMWFATRYGLNRYDGEEVISYYSEPSANGKLSNSFITDVEQDEEGNIWIGTYGGGINIYNDRKACIRQEVFNEKITSQLTNKLVTSIIKDKEGHIWISTEKSGLYHLDPGKETLNQYLHYTDDPTSLSDNSVLGLAEDGQGNIWIGSWGKGLNLFLRQSQRFVHFSTASHPLIPSNIIRCITASGAGHIWVGFQEGLRKVVYEQGQYKVLKVPVENSELLTLLDRITVLSVLEDKHNRLWIGSENEGLIVVDLKKGNYQRYWRNPYADYSIGSNSIWSLHEDRYGTIWIGTFDQGVYKVDPYEKRFTHIYQAQNPQNTLSHNLVSSFAEDENGNLYIGTDGGGLSLLQRDGKYVHFDPVNSTLRSRSILCLQYDSQGNLWIGSWEGGLTVKKKNSNTFSNFPYGVRGKGSSGKYIFDFFEDSKKHIWIASFRAGLDVYLPEKDTFYHFSMDDPIRKLTANSIHTVIEDADGHIWVGTEGSGLDKLVLNDRLETVKVENYNSQGSIDQKISHNFISCLFIDSNKKLWVGTHGGGVNWFDKDKEQFISITKEDGLPSNLVYAIEEDKEGKLWFSTNKGLACYNPATRAIETFDVEDGLQALEFFPRSSLAKKDGELLFGGINGFNRFYPEKIKAMPLQGNLYITNFTITGSNTESGKQRISKENLLHTKSIELPYRQNDFTLSFSYLNFTQAAKNHYQYKLEGYDQEWQDVGTRNTAFYTNVPAGNYTFKVRAANGDQQWNQQQASLGITILRPWYASYWAYAVYAGLIVTFLLWRRNIIIHKEKLKNNLRLEHLELKKLKELDEIKSSFFANISHEFRTPLTLILSPLKSMYYDERWQEHRPRIKSMVKQAERLLSLINQILDLSKLEAGSTKLEAQKLDLVAFLKPLVYSFTNYAEKRYIKYKISLPQHVVYIYADPDKLEKIIINLLSNAFKFTPEFGEVTFRLEVLKNEVQLTVADTGEGIPEEELSHIFTRYYQGHQHNKRRGLGTGIGLALTKELVELHKGQITVDAYKGSGAHFHVYLPLGKEHLQFDEVIEKPDLAEATETTDILAVAPALEEETHGQEKQEVKSDARKQTILIAEDNQEIRTYIKEYLANEFDILEAPDGERAYELVVEQKPDMVITDVLMPGMDGFMLCQKLKEQEETNHIPTIILTAKASSESMEKGYSLGADYYITKPFNPKHLHLQIKNILKGRTNYKTQVLHGNHINLNPKNVEVVNADEEFIKHVISIIELHIADVDFNINDLCKEIGISRIQLYRKLKSNISMSANELIRHVRLQRAAQLIRQEQLSIAEITYMVGFTDLQYFRSCFKKQFGVNPSEYMNLKKE